MLFADEQAPSRVHLVRLARGDDPIFAVEAVKEEGTN